MNFDSVYKCLVELFPEVDHRMLRAVALENPKDVHVAINDVLTEVIPCFLGEYQLPPQDPKEVENKMQMDSLKSGTIGDEASDVTSQGSGVAHLDFALNQSVSETSYVASDDFKQSCENTETASLEALASVQEDRSDVELNQVAPGKLNGLIHEDSEYNDHEQNLQITKILNLVTEDIKQNKTPFDGVNHSHNIHDLDGWHVHESYRDDRPFSADENCDSQTANPSFGNHSPADENCDSQTANPSFGNHSPVQSVIHLHSESDYQKSNANGTSNPSPKQECSTGEMIVIEDGLVGHTIVTQSGQPCSIELLEKNIEDAKSNKITLFSAMQSVIDKMKALEHVEKYVEKVKEDSANGELEILAKVEEMKQIVARTKEANDMHAGEVYGEKAILATETRELQSRLLSLSEERDKSLSILDEMHATIGARMTAVEAVLKVIQEENLAKEECARKALAEQEALMEKVLEESRILEREAKENAKLREFLIHHGQLVDILQGEISVIVQDVRHLKEKFDLDVPLSKSLSSSQTSCILASSGSSLKSAASDLARFCSPLTDTASHLDAEKGSSSNLDKEGSRASSFISSKSSMSSNNLKEERSERNHLKACSDDGWDVFDKDAEFADAPHLVDAKERSLREF